MRNTCEIGEKRITLCVGVRKDIMRKLRSLPEGYPFGYVDLEISSERFAAAAKVLGRMVNEGVIQRSSPGVYFKPKETSFGPARLSEEIIVRTYLFRNGKRCAYITGLGLFNRMGLTTQVPKVLQVASFDRRISAEVGNLRLKPVKSYVRVTDRNIVLLEILDVIKEFKNIPDIEPRIAIKFLRKKLNQLQANKVSEMVEVALKYPPRVRAMLGALLSVERPDINIGRLRASLHPLSKYDFGLSEADLAKAKEWKLF